MAEKDASEKKTPKKVVIIDANEPKEATPEKENTEPLKTAGDTPPLAIKIVDGSDEDTTVNDPDTVELPSEAPEEITAKSSDTSEPLPKDITVEEAMQSATQEEADEAPKATEDLVDDTHEELSEATPEPTDQQPESAVPEEEWDDKTTEQAVDDIVATESDELLARQDEAKTVAVAKPKKQKRSLKTKLKELWSIPSFKWGLLAGILVIIASLGIIPAVRYALLNTAGVRAGMSLTVLSNETQQPLKNAQVTVSGQTAQTDEEGRASFTKIRLGKASIVVSKRGYAEYKQDKTLGWGSNPLGQVKLTISGSQFSFVAKDFLSGKALESAEAISGDYNAQADKEGKIILPLDTTNDKDIEVTIKSVGYRDEKITVSPSDSNVQKDVVLVAAKQHVFVTKRTGKLDIYKVDADGKNEKVLMAATGNEREDIAILSHPTKDYVAVVSTKEGKRNKDGYLLSNLFVINVATGDVTTLTLSERIGLKGWIGDRIIYTAVTEGVSAANPARSKILSFEIGQPGAKELASANYFNDVVVFKDAVFYAPSSYSIPVSSVKYYKINADGSGISQLLDKEIWNIFRTDYDTLLLTVQQEWYQQAAGATPTKLPNPPSNPSNRIYIDNQSKTKSLWVDNRDGKGVLLAYDIAGKKEETLQTQAGLSLPVSWLNDTTYVYRISDGREVADYVKSIDGGEAKKIKDVTNTNSNYSYYY